jgi:DNA-binding transcriptional LysR family regulator
VDPLGLRALVAVSESGSLAKAARREKTSRATLSRRLHELSEELGQPVLDPKRRGVHLSIEGQALAERAPEFIQRAAELKTRFSDPHRVPGHFRVVAPVGLAPPVVSLIARVASRAAPESHFVFYTCSDPLAEMAERADLGVVFGPDVPEGPWRTSTIVRLSEHLVASRAYLDAHGTPTSLEELHDHPLLLWTRPDVPAGRLPLVGGGSYPVRPWLQSNDPWLLQRAAEADAGIALTATGGLPRRGHPFEPLTPVLPDLVQRTCTLQAILPRSGVALPRARTLFGLVRALVAEF